MGAMQAQWMAEDPLDTCAVSESVVIGASIGAKLVGCVCEGQCTHCWGREQGQCGWEIWGIWPGMHGCGSQDQARARGMWPTNHFGWHEGRQRRST